jgi:hypothetical protein
MAATLSYSDAHLIVAAVRVLEHQRRQPPSVKDVCSTLQLSQERGYFLCRSLTERGILETIEGAYGEKLYIRDHSKIEDIPSEQPASTLQDELERFKASQKGMASKVAGIQAERKEKRKSLFEEMEKKLKAELDKKP